MAQLNEEPPYINIWYITSLEVATCHVTVIHRCPQVLVVTFSLHRIIFRVLWCICVSKVRGVYGLHNLILTKTQRVDQWLQRIYKMPQKMIPPNHKQIRKWDTCFLRQVGAVHWLQYKGLKIGWESETMWNVNFHFLSLIISFIFKWYSSLIYKLIVIDYEQNLDVKIHKYLWGYLKIFNDWVHGEKKKSRF